LLFALYVFASDTTDSQRQIAGGDYSYATAPAERTATDGIATLFRCEFALLDPTESFSSKAGMNDIAASASFIF